MRHDGSPPQSGSARRAVDRPGSPESGPRAHRCGRARRPRAARSHLPREWCPAPAGPPATITRLLPPPPLPHHRPRFCSSHAGVSFCTVKCPQHTSPSPRFTHPSHAHNTAPSPHPHPCRSPPRSHGSFAGFVPAKCPAPHISLLRAHPAVTAPSSLHPRRLLTNPPAPSRGNHQQMSNTQFRRQPQPKPRSPSHQPALPQPI